ncbi:hypothetical protein MNBD_GAMMA12-3977 [hydrothermal vent metagenome]|uniref:Uncharacterized protein n=1 Tax=hydrothermal vent metagenome TaxID=652676 RepID=A0A3B0Y7V4_9ZZZZ
MSPYLPWWVTAILLAAITLGFYLTLHRTLGVSGFWTRVVVPGLSGGESEVDELFRKNPKMLNDALMAATVAEFGKEEVAKYISSRHGSTDISPATALTPRVPRSALIMFLIMLIIGGVIGGMVQNKVGFQLTLGEVHTKLFGSGFATPIMLFFGGLMVGFGTQMSGGCTTGHGLSGFSRFVPSSMVATMIFFTSAIIFSMIASFFGGL